MQTQTYVFQITSLIAEAQPSRHELWQFFNNVQLHYQTVQDRKQRIPHFKETQEEPEAGSIELIPREFVSWPR